MQTRIVRDLHDELGTSLARLSVLSEVARRQVVTAPERSSAVLDEIGATARQLIRASGDLAVSLDPGRASLGKLLVRLRRVASELLEEAGVRLRIEHRGEDPEHVELSPEQRRHLLAALQEALHNVARHARASWVAIAVATSRSAITVTLADDGCGLPTERSEHGGQGISNVVARALALGGRATVASSPGAGTCWTLEIPRRAPGLLARRRPCPR